MSKGIPNPEGEGMLQTTSDLLFKLKDAAYCLFVFYLSRLIILIYNYIILFIGKPDNMTIASEKFKMVIRHAMAKYQIKT